MKRNVARNFIHKVFTLTDKGFLRESQDKIKKILRLNNYSDGLIKNLINQEKYSVRGQTNTNQQLQQQSKM